jgi:hypothetical protein
MHVEETLVKDYMCGLISASTKKQDFVVRFPSFSSFSDRSCLSGRLGLGSDSHQGSHGPIEMITCEHRKNGIPGKNNLHVYSDEGIWPVVLFPLTSKTHFSA